jgi:hypothetical protein
MTELEAINYILNQINSPGVTAPEVGMPDYDAAVARLAEASSWVQKRGWWYNTETNVTLTPEVNGTIILPTNLMKILTASTGFMLDRSGLAYDANTQSTDFSAYSSINVDWVLLQAWDDLPATAQDVIRMAAAQEMIIMELEDMRKADALTAKYQEAYVEMKKDDLEVKKRSTWYNPAYIATRGGVRPNRTGGIFPSGNNLGR